MAFELDRDSSFDIPRVPESWMEKPSRIYEILPGDPTYINHGSVVRDIKTGEIGIDTNDRLPEVTPRSRFAYPEPIAAMRVLFTEKIGPDSKCKDGLIVDLRYKLGLDQRDLRFHDDTYYDDDQNVYNKTIPVLGAIVKIDNDNFVFRSGKATLLLEYAQSLIEFVDNDRKSRDLPVYKNSEEHEEFIELDQESESKPIRPAPGPIRRFMKLFYDTNSSQTE